MIYPCEQCGWVHQDKLSQLACWAVWGLPAGSPNVKELLRQELTEAQLANPGWASALDLVVARGHSRTATQRTQWEALPVVPQPAKDQREAIRSFLLDHGLNPAQVRCFTTGMGLLWANVEDEQGHISTAQLALVHGPWEMPDA